MPVFKFLAYCFGIEYLWKMSKNFFGLVTELNLSPLTWCTAKPISKHWIVMKERTVVIARNPTWDKPRRMGSSCSKDLNSSMAFRERLLKAKWGRGSQGAWLVCGQSSQWLVVRYCGSQHHQPSVSNRSRVYVLMVSMKLISSTWWGFSICKTTHGYGQDIIYSSWGGTKYPWLYV